MSNARERGEEEETTTTTTTRSREEDAFVLIERGNALEGCGNHWSAAGCFGRASELLQEKGDDVFASMVSSSSSSSSKKRRMTMQELLAEGRKCSEQEKIGRLYYEKSHDYLFQARDCLLQALQFETTQDQNRLQLSQTLASSYDQRRVSELAGDLKMQMPSDEAVVFDPLCRLLTNVEAHRRTRIFQQLYSKPPLQVPKAQETTTHEQPHQVEAIATVIMDEQESQQQQQDDDDLPRAPVSNQQDKPSAVVKDKDGNEQLDVSQLSLEERLARLETTLPPIQSEQERVKDRLQNLGVFLPPPSNHHHQLQTEMTEDEQINAIMEQATDEAAFYNTPNKDHDDQQEEDVNAILRKSGIRIDIHQYDHLIPQHQQHHHHNQETVQDLLNQAKHLQNQKVTATTTTADVDASQMESSPTESKEPSEEEMVQTIVEAATQQIHNENHHPQVEPKKDIEKKEEEDTTIKSKEIMMDNNNNNKDDTKDGSTKQVTVTDLLHRAEKLKAEATTNRNHDPDNMEVSKVENMKDTIKLLTAAQNLIDDAMVFFDEDILLAEDLEEDESQDSNGKTSLQTNNQMREKGKASIRAAQECLSKLLDSWP